MCLEGGDEFVLADLAAVETDIDEPCLVVDAGADVVELPVPGAENFGDLLGPVLDAVAETDRVDLAVFDRRPGVHRHRVGIVEELGAGLSHLADVLAEIQDHRNVALAVEDAAGADRVADALVDAVLQWNANIVGIGLEAADAHAADDVARTFQRLAAVGRRRHPRGQFVRLDDPVEDRLDHGEVVLAQIRQRELDVPELRHGKNVGEELLGEADAAGADDGDLEAGHGRAIPPQTATYALKG
jgi:hypothetical protein